MLLYNFLIERLSNAGVKHAFGIPGESIAEFYHELWKCKEIELITNTDESHSGFAADAYARINGIGCVVVTGGVGASKVINAVQCAYAERSPLVVISGSYATNADTSSQIKMFEKITCASIVLDNSITAGYAIDSAFEALKHYKRPIYIELPYDMAKKSISYDVYKQGTPTSPASDSEELQEAIDEVGSWIREAQKPVILVGVELARYALTDSLVKFAERNNIPVTTTTLSKSAVNELHPLFKGIYCGNASKPEVKELIENSDCLLTFGVVAIDMLGDMPAKTKKKMALAANIDGLQVRNHSYSKVGFADFCKAIFKMDFGRVGISPIRATINLAPFEPKKQAITTARLFEKINTILNDSMAVVCDIGDCTYGATDLVVRSHGFLCPAYYRSMGVAIPGALGVQTASPSIRPIVVVGDGAAQMSLLELSTIANRGLNPIVFILNNGGYLTQRIILDGDYNNVRRWKYHSITEVIGAGEGYDVCHEEAMDQAVDAALASKQLSVINVHICHDGMSPGLRRKIDSKTEAGK